MVSDRQPTETSTIRSTALQLMQRLEQLRDEMRRRHVESEPLFERVHPSQRHSASNLIDYLTLRHYDLRDIQDALAELGLSSLGRAEEHVITSVERVLENLHLLAGDGERPRTEAAVSFAEGRKILDSNADILLGPNRLGRPARILVTIPSEGADDFSLITELLGRGMDCARINCAHDDAERWARMVVNLRRAADQAARPCRILMDLPGPKLRTGPIEPGPRVVRLRPRRDPLGRVVAPAQALLVADGDVSLDVLSGSTTMVPVARDWLERLGIGDEIRFTDTRDSRRALVVTATVDRNAWVECHDTAYVATGTRLTGPHGDRTTVGTLPAREQWLRLHVGDVLTLTSDLVPAHPNGDGSNATARGLRIGCTSSSVLDGVRIGHRVYLDDGRIGGQAIATRHGEVDVRITNAAVKGSKLRAEKGINLPHSASALPALSADDLPTLRFIIDHADLVGLSFAQSPDDVLSLRRHLDEFGGANLGIVLKVETARGFSELPEILLAAMASERVGVMVARGDLAVECGFERLSEVQEEILWLCESAHIPVIWATEVLDQMARTGRPSRAEISDVILAERSECVMLNKGPYITDAVATLDDILKRMSSYQHKKVALLRQLKSWSPDPTT